jgi:hypothetical protein
LVKLHGLVGEVFSYDMVPKKTLRTPPSAHFPVFAVSKAALMPVAYFFFPGTRHLELLNHPLLFAKAMLLVADSLLEAGQSLEGSTLRKPMLMPRTMRQWEELDETF